MTPQVGSKVKFSIICHCWLRRAKQPYQTEIKTMERNASRLGYLCPPKPFMILYQIKFIQGHEVKKFKFKI